MFIELHILQNFAPSNLNRGDTGSPKDCEFGGYRRARISSQCLKRAMREAFNSPHLLNGGNKNALRDRLAVRTKRLVEEVAKSLVEKGRDKEEAEHAVETALNGVNLKVKEDKKTEYLLFLGRDEINRIAQLCDENYDALRQVSGGAVGDAGGKRASAKEAKKAAKNAVPPELQKAFEEALNGGKAIDLALFGRMLADLPSKNIDAASQVAHAISTNKTGVEFDFYTAVDDLRPEDTEGADMLGTVEFNSACFYRYANVDFRQLNDINLGSDTELALDTVEAFLRAAVKAVPTGKQNSMAAQNPPSFVLAVARHSGLWSLANAFIKPVEPTRTKDLMENSVERLGAHWQQHATMYGEDEIVDKCFVSLDGNEVGGLAGARVNNIGELVRRMCAALSNGSELGGEKGGAA